MIWEVWTGEPAFGHLTFAEIFAQVVVHQARPPLPPDMPPALAQLMQACWDPEPTKRPDMRTALAHIEAMMAEEAGGGKGAAGAKGSSSGGRQEWN